MNSPLHAIQHLVAVASGKGGVGKSTVAVNLALALSQLGKKVGILDADIYGPSLPMLFGLKDKQPPIDAAKKKFVPLEKFGVKVMSIGFLIKEADAVVWRGPMIHKLLQQFLEDVDWGELDCMVVDLPPGTGDVQISISQLIPLSGAVIVTTPQDMALADVVRGVAMFGKVGVPLLGVIENMSYFECPQCHHHTEIFSHGGGKKKAEELQVPFLGDLPLDLQTREGSDSGNPIVAVATQYSQSMRFHAIAKHLLEQLEKVQRAPVKMEL